MKIVRSQTDGWYVLQESLDTRSTVEDERSEDDNGHVMLLPEIEFDYDLPVQAEDPILLEMDQFLANANEDGNSQEGGTLRHDDYYPDSNLFSLFNESDFISDNDQSDRVKSPLYSTTNRSTFDGEQLVKLTTDFGTSQTVDYDVRPESIRDDQFVENSSSDSDSSSSESSSSESSSSESSSSESSSSDSPSSASESDSDSSDSSVESSLSDSSSNVVVQKLTTRQRKRLVETAEQREERCRTRRERERQQRAAMTPEELAKFREKKRASNRASELKMRLKKAAELQKGLGLKDPGLKLSGHKVSGKKDSGLKDSEPKRKRPVAQIPAPKFEKKQQVVQQNKNRKKSRTQMSIKELEKRRSVQRNQRRNRLARMTEQERQKHRERIRAYDRLWREKKKAQYSIRKNASSSKLPQNDELPLLKKKKTENQKQPQNNAIVDLFEAQRERKNAQARMRRRAALASETPEQREERLRKRREQKRNRKEIPQAREARPDQSEVENHFRQMASMITSKQLTEHRDRKRKRRNGGGNDPDYRPKLRGLPKRQRRQRPSIVDYSDSDD